MAHSATRKEDEEDWKDDLAVTPTNKQPFPGPSAEQVKECDALYEAVKTELAKQIHQKQVENAIPEDLGSKDAYEEYAKAYWVFEHAARVLEQKHELLHIARELSVSRARTRHFERELQKASKAIRPKRYKKELFPDDDEGEGEEQEEGEN